MDQTLIERKYLGQVESLETIVLARNQLKTDADIKGVAQKGGSVFCLYLYLRISVTCNILFADDLVRGSGSRQQSSRSTRREGRSGGYSGFPFCKMRSLIYMD